MGIHQIILSTFALHFFFFYILFSKIYFNAFIVREKLFVQIMVNNDGEGSYWNISENYNH